jgi:broad specificity phosphatase PhoE
MQTSIYFVRHGKVYNPTDILYGRLPRFGLAEEGKQQIAQTAHYLSRQGIDLLYSSPLLRAKETAEIIRKKLNLPKIHFSKYLLEILTSLQGTSFTYIRTLNYDVFAGPDKKDISGETIEEVAARVEKFMSYVIKTHPGKKVVAVTHGDLLMLLQAKFAGLPIVNASIRPGEENYVQTGEVYKVTCDENIPLMLESVFKPQ